MKRKISRKMACYYKQVYLELAEERLNEYVAGHIWDGFYEN